MNPPLRILVVEDQADLRMLIRLALEPLAAEMREVVTGMEALLAVRHFKPDVVILDVMLPGQIDGYQVCQAIKQNPLTRSTKVIMVSARGQKSDIEKGYQMQADRYLVKPFSPLELLREVKS